MAHVGDELGLCLGGQFGIDLRRLERDGLLFLGNGKAQMVREVADLLPH